MRNCNLVVIAFLNIIMLVTESYTQEASEAVITTTEGDHTNSVDLTDPAYSLTDPATNPTNPISNLATGFGSASTSIHPSSVMNPASSFSNSAIDRSSHAHIHVDHSHKGFWAKKFAWRPRWVKTWKERKVYVAVWKRMWGPVEVKEWVPVPKPPPGWVKHDAGSYIVKKPYH